MARRNKYDIKSIKRLYEEYQITQQELASFIGITRQAMNVALQKEYFPYWEVKELSEVEKKVIGDMIDERETEYRDMSLHIKIYCNMMSCALLIKNDKTVRCFFEMPDDIEEALYEAGFHKYRDHDFEAIKLLSEYSDQDKVIKITDPDDRLKIKEFLSKSYFTSLSQYCRYLGFNYTHANALTFQEICAKIEKFQCPETNSIYIGSERNEYFWFTRRAYQEGKTIQEWMAGYGYKYDSRGKEHTEQRYISFIERNLVVKDNLVYIDYLEYDYFYSCLTNLANNRYMTMDALLQKWGFIRVSKKDYYRILAEDRCLAQTY